ncbi:MAG: hypothetical protein ACHQDF_01110 [Chitinophagales bacterium]
MRDLRKSLFSPTGKFKGANRLQFFEVYNSTSIWHSTTAKLQSEQNQSFTIRQPATGEDPKRIIENIVNQVITTSKGNFSTLKHLQQLRILAQLRNLAPENLEIMDSIANYISEEKDILYRRGEKKGMEKEKESLVKNLLLNTDFTIAKIASLTSVTEAFVKKVSKALK